jgi:hypothetical protein
MDKLPVSSVELWMMTKLLLLGEIPQLVLRSKMIQFSYFCSECPSSARGVVNNKMFLDKDDWCYACGAAWEKVIIDKSHLLQTT